MLFKGTKIFRVGPLFSENLSPGDQYFLLKIGPRTIFQEQFSSDRPECGNDCFSCNICSGYCHAWADHSGYLPLYQIQNRKYR